VTGVGARVNAGGQKSAEIHSPLTAPRLDGLAAPRLSGAGLHVYGDTGRWRREGFDLQLGQPI